MAQVTLDQQVLEDLLLQAKVAPPRDQQAAYAVADAEEALRRVTMAPQAYDTPLPLAGV